MWNVVGASVSKKCTATLNSYIAIPVKYQITAHRLWCIAKCFHSTACMQNVLNALKTCYGYREWSGRYSVSNFVMCLKYAAE